MLILLVNPTLLALHDQGFELGETLLDGFEVVGLKRNHLILHNMAYHLILLVNPTLLTLHDQVFELGEELLDGFEIGG